MTILNTPATFEIRLVAAVTAPWIPPISLERRD
jgi:hypothetical protein